MKIDQHTEELLTLYSLGLLEGEELREIEELLKFGDKKYLEYLENVSTTFSSLPYALEDKPLSPDLKNKIFSQISAASQQKKYDRTSFLDIFNISSIGFFKLATAFACAALIYLGYSNHTLKTELQKQQIEIAKLQSNNDNLKSEMMGFLENDNVKVFQLASYKSDININARLLWDLKSNDAILYVVNIPKLDKGKTFQFWTDSEEGMESMGTFTSDTEKIIKIKCMPKYNITKAFYISIEPEGGMPNPTGETFMVGEI